MGDNRTYEYLCLLRAITSEDGMTADYYEFKKSFMQTISNKIVNSIRGINRVVYDVTSKPPSTIELEQFLIINYDYEVFTHNDQNKRCG